MSLILLCLLIDCPYFFDRFWHHNCIRNDDNFGINFDSDFSSIWDICLVPFGFILAAFGSHLGVLGGSRARQRGSQKRVKWGLGARVAPGGFEDPILEDFGEISIVSSLFFHVFFASHAPSLPEARARASTRS